MKLPLGDLEKVHFEVNYVPVKINSQWESDFTWFFLSQFSQLTQNLLTIMKGIFNEHFCHVQWGVGFQFFKLHYWVIFSLWIMILAVAVNHDFFLKIKISTNIFCEKFLKGLFYFLWKLMQTPLFHNKKGILGSFFAGNVVCMHSAQCEAMLWY